MIKSQSIDFKEKYGPWALVAGGALGLGECWCIELARQGLNIISIDRDTEALKRQGIALRDDFGVDVISIQADLSDENVIDVIKQKTEDIEIGFMVFSAAMTTDPAIVRPHLFHEGSLSYHQKLINLNIKAVSDFSYHFGQLMKTRKKGGMVLISSGADGQGSPFNAHYGASKGYQTLLGEALWFELKPYNVDVIAAPLGMTNTTAMDKFQNKEHLARLKPMDPTEVVIEILQNLGKQPQIIPGRKNRLGQLIMKRLMGRESAIRTMANLFLDKFLIGEKQYDIYRK